MNKLGLIGYGKMGKLIEWLAPQFDCEIAAIIDPELGNEISDETLEQVDVCIEFSSPGAVFDNLQKITELKKNIVCGTTGWNSRLSDVKKLVSENQVGMIYGSNFSIGMNVFYSIVEHSAKLFDKTGVYDQFGLEIHHKYKVDSPSGTAKVLTDLILANSSVKKTAQFDRSERKISDEEFHFASIRAGEIPGIHLVGFDSPADTIELKHTAKNRTGLATGALKAANWIKQKKGLYNFSDVFESLIS
ncbi:MAG: 4-hydroxy-tetrahydrodipicolinate reductase [Candidatus Cloacimonetes bacterium]|nr:4-hydroxy-tetrahydrodipicolinate reductase [Candidatus Cloacimonadota bacterium]